MFNHSFRKFSAVLAASVLLAACAVPPAPAAPAPAAPAPAVQQPPTAAAPTQAPTAAPVAIDQPKVVGTTPMPRAPRRLSINPTECITAYNPDTDYFPEKATVQQASGLKIEYFNNYKVVSVLTPWREAKEQFQYVLVQCGTPAPTGVSGLEKALVIDIPIKTIAVMNTTNLPMLDAQGLLDKLVGLDSFLYASNMKVREMIASDRVTELGEGAQVNIEKAIALKPDLVLTSGSGFPEYDAHPKLLEAKIVTAVDGSYMENTPLGRAEWSKFVAAFFNTEAKAEASFSEISTKYDEIAAKAKAATTKPNVLMNMPYKDTWSMPGGASFSARLLADAGATYSWSDDTTTGALPLKFEEVLDKGSQADVWLLNAFGAFPDSKAVTALDPRYAEFAALKNGKAWNNDLKVNENGGNDFYETGAARPDLVLADLVKIVHPELMAEHAFVFYRQVAK
ncbi:MAG: ABC transporter substrate-binding protein [Anaerolineae bacterium]|nr:ABC transporter substrate-binding protein [Anaerolineae bacterium]